MSFDEILDLEMSFDEILDLTAEFRRNPRSQSWVFIFIFLLIMCTALL